MSVEPRFIAAVEAYLDDRAGTVVPDYLEATLARARRTRQRRAWSSLERWLPVDTTFRPRFFNAPRLGQVLLVGALILALVGALLLYAGSRQPHLPPPFGPARNGVLLSSGNGDIVAIDPVTLQRRVIVGGPTFDFGPGFSRDGTKLSFLRGNPTDCGKPDCGLMLMVANADGSDIRQLTPGLVALDWLDWSPDGSEIAIDAAPPAGGAGHVLIIVPTDGSSTRTLDLGRPIHEFWWLPPDGKEIVLRGERPSPSDPPVAIWAVNVSTGGLRDLSPRPAHSDNDYQSLAVSSDGHLIAYRDDGDPGGFQLHILDLRTGQDRILRGPKGQEGGIFSPDSTKIAFLRHQGTSVQLVVAPVDGSDPGRALGRPAPFGDDGPTINNYTWSPDGTAVLANYDAEKVARLLPIDGSTPIDLDHGDLALPSYQRLAP